MKYEYGNWFLVILSIVIFLVFIKSAFKPRSKIDWRTFKMFSAFIIALFAEMYGFPLTIYLLTSFFGNKFFNIDFSHDSGHILNTILGIGGDPYLNWLHLVSNGLIIGGLLLISSAWKVLYSAQKKNMLATTGVYRYILHPQYAGFIFIIVGFLFQWPTLITLVMAPILIIRYIVLAKKEEQEMYKRFGETYNQFKKEIPGFFPSPKTLSKNVLNKFLEQKSFS